MAAPPSPPPRVAVVGGGPAGAVAALVLARRGIAVVVLEAQAGPVPKVGETLPPSLTPLLRKLGLDGLLERDGHLHAEGIRALWGSAHPAERPFLASPQGLGWHLDRRRFEARLATAAQEAGAAWRWGCRVERVLPVAREAEAARTLGGARWRLEIRQGPVGDPDDEPPAGIGPGAADAGGSAGSGGAPMAQDESVAAAADRVATDPAAWRAAASATLEVEWIADATGRAAHIARRLGARRVRYDRLVGVAALVSPAPAGVAGGGDGDFGSEEVRSGYTLIEAVTAGWWYSAALSDGRLAVGLFGDGDLLDRKLLGRRPGAAAAWASLLSETRATGARVSGAGGGASPPRLRVLPAESSRLDAIGGDGWLAVGDAAAAYDPISSHGIAAAMGSGFYGGHAIADLLAGREDARAAYLEVMQRAYGDYLDLLRAHYATEGRWPGSAFWGRRHDATFGLASL